MTDEDGYFRIIDRKKDMIIAGDYNVFPRDVEEVLYESPKVFEAAVVGIPYGPQEQAVEAMIKAYVVLKQGERATEEEILGMCKTRLEDLEAWEEDLEHLPEHRLEYRPRQKMVLLVVSQPSFS